MPIWLNGVAVSQWNGLGVCVLRNQSLFNSMKALVQTSNGSNCEPAVTDVDEQKGTHTYRRCNDPVVSHLILEISNVFSQAPYAVVPPSCVGWGFRESDSHDWFRGDNCRAKPVLWRGQQL